MSTREPYGPAPEEPGAGPLPGMPPLGGLGRRLLARVVDGVLVAVACSLVLGWFVDWHSRYGQAALSFATGLVYWVYESLMLAHGGQTVGKRITGVRVAMLADGSPPPPAAAWARAAVYTLPAALCCGLWTVLDGGWCLVDRPYRQCLHDKAVRTVVVSSR